MKAKLEPRLDIVLASRSPRRQALLHKIVPEFRVIPSDVDEEQFRDQDPVSFALRAAEAKARDVGDKHPESVIIAADTLVFLDDEIMGKPKDRLEARRMLEKLSGQRHRVITAVALFHRKTNRLLTGYEISEVHFKALSAEEIEAYLAARNFDDKAGSYAIQDVGDTFVAKLKGDYENVVGLPTRKVRRLLREFLQPEAEVEVIDIAFPHGWGVANPGGLITFVPGVVPGDRVRIQVTGQKKRYNFGRLLRLISPSPDRVQPECPHFGNCGGCVFQNLAYARQLQLKEKYIRRTLQVVGKIDLTRARIDSVVGSPDLYFYRNKMEYAFGGEAGQVFLGLRSRTLPGRKYEKRTLPVSRCPIFSPLVELIFPPIIDFVQRSGLPPYHPVTQRGFFRNFVLREAKATGEMLAILVTRTGHDLHVRQIAEELEASIPSVKSFWLAQTDRVSDVVDARARVHVSGKHFIEEKLAGLCFHIGPADFFQPNPRAAKILYDQIVNEAKERRSQRALGLYSGAGAIEIFLSRAVGEVVGIDSEPANIARAEENCRINGVDNCRFLEGRVERVLKERNLGPFDLVVLDPPRSGMSGQALRQVIALKAPTILYVSCNPAAFARDLNLFSHHDYEVSRVVSFDFFPHTPHVECLAVVSKSSSHLHSV